MFKKAALTLALSLSVTLMGCASMPQPIDLIESPIITTVGTSVNQDASTIQIARNFLPKGSQFTSVASPKNAKPVMTVDFDQDGKMEIFATYKTSAQSTIVHGMVLEQRDKKWRKVLVVDDPINQVTIEQITPGNAMELLLGIGPQWSEQDVLRGYWLKNGVFEKFIEVPYTAFSLWTEKNAKEKRIVLESKMRGVADFIDFPVRSVIYFEMREDYLVMKHSQAGQKAHLADYFKDIVALDTENPGNVNIQLTLADLLIEQERYQEAYKILGAIQLDSDQENEGRQLAAIWFDYYAKQNMYVEAEQAMINCYKIFDDQFNGPDNEQVAQLKDLFLSYFAMDTTQDYARVLLALNKKDAAVDLYTQNIALIERVIPRINNMSLNNLKASYFPAIEYPKHDADALASILELWKSELAELKK